MLRRSKTKELAQKRTAECSNANAKVPRMDLKCTESYQRQLLLIQTLRDLFDRCVGRFDSRNISCQICKRNFSFLVDAKPSENFYIHILSQRTSSENCIYYGIKTPPPAGGNLYRTHFRSYTNRCVGIIQSLYLPKEIRSIYHQRRMAKN